MDRKVPRENKTLSGLVPETQIQHHPKQIHTCTVAAEASKQFC